MCMWMSSNSTRQGNWSSLNLRANRLQAGDQLLAFLGGDQADIGQHLGMGDRAGDIVGIQSPVEADALGESINALVG